MISFHILPCDHEQINNLLPLAKLLPDKRRDELLSLVDEMPLGLTITVEKIKKERSRQQEKYYRKWCNAFARHCGLTPDEMHDEMLCLAYGSEEVETKFGIKRRPMKRSGQLTAKKYSELIHVLVMTAAEMGFAVPPPI
jgi:hypothetical protein|tara:strand:+ start:221 stop:637 length:417 start_codon:yes stop_codon:yes gene_type:complete